MSEISDFFSKSYRISSEEYGLLIENGPEALVSELYGHNLGRSASPFPVERLEAEGVSYLKNKLIGHYDPESKEIYYKDTVNDYIFNSLGFRSPREYDGSEDILVVGCSHTMGEGVPEGAIWGSQVANSLGLTYANIARPGTSPYWAVDSVYGYIKKFGKNPKIILALMPDFHRIQTINNPLISISFQGGFERRDAMRRGIYQANQWIWSNPLEVPKYLEKPFQSEYSMARETAFMFNLRAIHALEEYCREAGIVFLWSTWAPDESILFSNLKKSYGSPTNYVDVEAANWHSTEEDGWHDVYHETAGDFGTDWGRYGHCENSQLCTGIACHSDLEIKYGSNFYIGTDNEKTPQHAHFGVHKHTHFAEKFLEKLNEIYE